MAGLYAANFLWLIDALPRHPLLILRANRLYFPHLSRENRPQRRPIQLNCCPPSNLFCRLLRPIGLFYHLIKLHGRFPAKRMGKGL